MVLFPFLEGIKWNLKTISIKSVRPRSECSVWDNNLYTMQQGKKMCTIGKILVRSLPLSRKSVCLLIVLQLDGAGGRRELPSVPDHHPSLLLLPQGAQSPALWIVTWWSLKGLAVYRSLCPVFCPPGVDSVGAAAHWGVASVKLPLERFLISEAQSNPEHIRQLESNDCTDLKVVGEMVR